MVLGCCLCLGRDLEDNLIPPPLSHLPPEQVKLNICLIKCPPKYCGQMNSSFVGSGNVWPYLLRSDLVASFWEAAFHCQSHAPCQLPNTFLSFMALPEALGILPFRQMFCIPLVADGMPAPFSSSIYSSPNKHLCKSFLVAWKWP